MLLLKPLIAFLKAHALYAYPILFFGSYIEILVPFSFVVPGEIFFYSGGVLSAAGGLNLWITCGVCALGGYLGDASSYYLGCRYAPRVEKWLTGWRFWKRIFLNGEVFLRHHGERSVLLGRFFGPVSWVVPFLAGSSGMLARRFLLLDLGPAAIAISIQVGIGYAMGLGLTYAMRFLHDAAFYLLIPFALVVIGVPLYREWRRPEPGSREHRRPAGRKSPLGG